MFDNKLKTPFIALIGAVALMAAAPAFAQGAAPAPAAAPAAAAPAAGAPAAAPADASAAQPEAPPQMQGGGKLNIGTMFMNAKPIVKVVMVGLMLCSVLTWALAILKFLEFRSLNRTTDNFLEAFRASKSISDMGRVAVSDEFSGNPIADMAAAAAQEIELSRQAGLQVAGEHRETTLSRAEHAVSAVQASLSRRLSSGMAYMASIGSNGPFIGLFGTVYGIMDSFIGIANTNTTNLAVVAPGIAEALLATGLGLFAAIPSVIFYNIFQTRISAFGARSEGFVAELMNAISRQLDKGA
ncbi:MotA/TolQ/ExbB proton channel family protein [Phenylobacterium sp.]|jgi:biopolymer transport protein ExbB|uniref:MotA/TolQ/ExbB proton channel family protein n=1 Tax=Phenylobacterium sp. TaxID=1871053 RepID=UPI002F3E4705